MAIKDVKFRNAKPKEKPYKVSDEKGLYLLVNPNGSCTPYPTMRANRFQII